MPQRDIYERFGILWSHAGSCEFLSQDGLALRQLGDLAFLTKALKELLVLIRYHFFEVKISDPGFFVFVGNEDIHAIGLAVDVGINPGQFFLKTFGSEPDSSQYTESPGPGDLGYYVSAVGKGENWQFYAEHFTDLCSHLSFLSCYPLGLYYAGTRRWAGRTFNDKVHHRNAQLAGHDL